MDNMPGRSTWHQLSSLLLGLPQDFRIEIAARVGAVGDTHKGPLNNQGKPA
jgi:hypothetical protein